MFERFTERARRAVVLAQDEARRLGHNYIGTEHVLLGLLREEEGIAARVLGSLGVTLDGVRGRVAEIVGRGEAAAPGQIPFTPRAKKVLELALREAISMGHGYIGTEHILLGLARENGGVAARILLDSGVDAERIRGEVVAALSGSRSGSGAAATAWFPDIELPGRTSPAARMLPLPALVVAAAGFPLGLLVGWLIWA
jgi:ATP-dependent Clp protease ATP-binding subunit ClpC